MAHSDPARGTPGDAPPFTWRPSPQRGWRGAVKRGLDVAVSGAALAALAPVMAGVAAAVRATMGRPVIFRQLRPGYRERLFYTYKFRTMRDARGPDGRPLPDAERLTRTGRLLRSLSLDELPQLWNVLRGEMSLVGPRPLLPRYLPRYSDRQRRRHEVRPGITGLAQVEGRNDTTWEARFARDLEYVEGWSLRLDLAILARTVGKVLRRSGVSRPGHETMPEFLGTEEEPPCSAGAPAT